MKPNKIPNWVLNTLNRDFTVLPEKGKIIRNIKTKGYFPGECAPSPNKKGYRMFWIRNGNNVFKATLHRIIYYYHTGEEPECVDHINGDTSDNRIKNLRGLTQSENKRNRHKKTGKDKDLPIGVTRRHRRGRTTFRVGLSINNNSLYKEGLNKDEAIKLASEFRKKHSPSWAREEGYLT